MFQQNEVNVLFFATFRAEIHYTSAWNSEYAKFPLNRSATPLCPFVPFIPGVQCWLAQMRFFYQHMYEGHGWCVHKVGILLPYITGTLQPAIFCRNNNFAGYHELDFHYVRSVSHCFILRLFFLNVEDCERSFMIVSRPQEIFLSRSSYVYDNDDKTC